MRHHITYMFPVALRGRRLEQSVTLEVGLA
jgi:hypothetical protein